MLGGQAPALLATATTAEGEGTSGKMVLGASALPLGLSFLCGQPCLLPTHLPFLAPLSPAAQHQASISGGRTFIAICQLTGFPATRNHWDTCAPHAGTSPLHTYATPHTHPPTQCQRFGGSSRGVPNASLSRAPFFPKDSSFLLSITHLHASASAMLNLYLTPDISSMCQFP